MEREREREPTNKRTNKDTETKLKSIFLIIVIKRERVFLMNRKLI
jgi:hypothetical protein